MLVHKRRCSMAALVLLDYGGIYHYFGIPLLTKGDEDHKQRIDFPPLFEIHERD